ncbi:MAG: hypothetical protein AB8C46_22670 [Burkholderiaceae bacterium]
MILRAFFSLIVFSILTAFWLSQTRNDSRLQPLTDPQVDGIACVSYAPYRMPGETPFDEGHQVSKARILDDLTRLSAVTNCVRTYSTQSGLQAVPKVAQSLNMQVLLGIWIGRKEADNRAEIDEGIAQAEAFPDTIRGVIVGNEVLLRREQTAQAMAAYLDEVRQAVSLPVTYADVWEFWVANKALQNHVDYLTVHILPYWEDHPVALEQAVEHVVEVFKDVNAQFEGKSMMIGETGWPSAGRQRGPARPGNVAQAEFIRAWVAAANTHQIDYNLIEAFDQPWKRTLEGAMGGHWGMLDSAGEQKFPWRGEMAENPTAWQQSLVAAALMIVAFVTTSLGLIRLQRGSETTVSAEQPSVPVTLTLAVVIGACVGVLLPAQWAYLSDWNRYPAEWIASTVFWGATLLLALLIPAVLGRSTPIPTGLAAWRKPSSTTQASGADLIARLTGVLRLVVLFGAALFLLLHAFDARYRGFAIPLYLLPFGCILSLWVAGHRISMAGREERWLGLVCLICLPFMLAPEIPANQDAWLLAALMLPLALYPLFADRSKNKLATNTAAAPGSTE